MSSPVVRRRGRPLRPVPLTLEQRAELERLRDTSPKPYLRERAAAIVKLAAGHSALEVAHTGLLRRRKRDTVYAWWRRYQAEGLPGLLIRSGRGRKPAFSPSAPHERRRQSRAPRRGAP